VQVPVYHTPINLNKLKRWKPAPRRFYFLRLMPYNLLGFAGVLMRTSVGFDCVARIS
jgi:hypothetical protein